MKNFKNYLSLLISSVALFNLHPAWAGKTEYDIPCEEQIFVDPRGSISNLSRKTVRISRYLHDTDVKKDAPSVVFFHGGPCLKNVGQFDKLIEPFVSKGFKVYVPEIIGSSYYATNGMDANEYKKNYCTDIQAILNHIKEESSGKVYAIAHSLGCHQLFQFMSQPQSQFNFNAISAIAGPWDRGASLLSRVNWKTEYERQKTSFIFNAQTHFVGYYTKLDGDQQPMTETYNYLLNENLNKSFSVRYHINQLKKLPPVLLMHAKDDKQVGFSLSRDMLKALQENGNEVSGYFLSKGEHGFIKNSTPDSPIEFPEIREKAVENMLNFFNSPHGGIYFDNKLIEFEDIPVERDARKEYEEFLEQHGKP